MNTYYEMIKNIPAFSEPMEDVKNAIRHSKVTNEVLRHCFLNMHVEYLFSDKKSENFIYYSEGSLFYAAIASYYESSDQTYRITDYLLNNIRDSVEKFEKIFNSL